MQWNLHCLTKSELDKNVPELRNQNYSRYIQNCQNSDCDQVLEKAQQILVSEMNRIIIWEPQGLDSETNLFKLHDIKRESPFNRLPEHFTVQNIQTKIHSQYKLAGIELIFFQLDREEPDSNITLSFDHLVLCKWIEDSWIIADSENNPFPEKLEKNSTWIDLCRAGKQGLQKKKVFPKMTRINRIFYLPVTYDLIFNISLYYNF